ncbi:hypothetical protein Taro_009963, partial [Colocasia esculenta]|nr:hypothetical protein [Colocasia esculenta]
PIPGRLCQRELLWATGVLESGLEWRTRSGGENGWFCLWALDLVEVRGGRASGETSFSLGCLVSLEVTPGCSFPTSWRSRMLVLRHETLLLPHVFDSAGSAGVVFGLTRVVVEAFLCFRCFVVLCSRLTPLLSSGRDSLSQEFVAGWLGWRFVARCVANSVSWSERELQECTAAVVVCTCCERGCCFARVAVGFVCSLRVLRCSRSSSLLVLVEVRFPQNCVVLVSGCCGIALWVEVSVVWLVAVALPSRLRCIAWLPCVLVQFSRTVGCCPGEGCSQDYSGRVSAGCCATSGLRLSSYSFFGFLGCDGGTPCVPRAGTLASFSRALRALPDGGLFSSLIFRWSLGVVVLSHGIWCHVAHCGDLCGEGPSPCAVLRAVCPVFSVRQHWFSVVGLLVQASSQSVFPLVPQLCLEALVTVWCVALSACGESLSVGLESFQAVGAVGYCTLSVFSFRCFVSLCLGGSWPVWPVVCFRAVWSLGALFCTLGGSWCLFGTVCCVVFLIVALSVVRQALVVACVWLGFLVLIWIPLRAQSRGFRLAVSVVLVGLVHIALVELSTSACVLCTIVVHPVSCRMSGLALPCGRVVVVTTRKSWCDLVPVVTVIPVATTRCVAFLSHLVNGSRQGSAFGLLMGICHMSGRQAGDVFGLTRVVVESSFASALLEFLLLWLVRDW